MIELYESNPHKITTAQKKAQCVCVSWFIETKSDVQTQQNHRSMKDTHHHILQFVHGDKDSVWCKEWATKNIWRKYRVCKASLSMFSYEVYPYCCQATGSTTCNSAQSPTQKFKIVCLPTANVTGTSAKQHAKTKRICSEHAPTNFWGWSIPQTSLFQWWGNFSCLRKVKQTQCKNLGIRKPPCDKRTSAR